MVQRFLLLLQWRWHKRNGFLFTYLTTLLNYIGYVTTKDRFRVNTAIQSGLSGKRSDLCSRGSRFEYQPGYEQSELRFFMIFFCPCGQIPIHTLKMETIFLRDVGVSLPNRSLLSEILYVVFSSAILPSFLHFFLLHLMNGMSKVLESTMGGNGHWKVVFVCTSE